MGSRVLRSTSRTSEGAELAMARFGLCIWGRRIPRSVISAKVKLADRCKSMFSEYTKVLNARRGSPEKKSVSARYEGLASKCSGVGVRR